ncbi:MAG: DNA-packaging protein [Pikeienuella sp.]
MPRSTVASLASQTEADRNAFLATLSPNALAALPFLWEHWAHPGHQLPPSGSWHTWVLLGGRGAGKTRAGAEWVRAQVEGATPWAPGRCRRIVLIGETLEQVRGVMVEGESGLLGCTPPDRRPVLKSGQHRLIWPNGAEAAMAAAINPEALRGPQFDAAWADELAKWRRCREAWDMLQFCLRLADATGRSPRRIVTTTPKDNPVLREILAAPDTRVTQAGTRANARWLAPGFTDRLEADYAGSRLGRQEIDGVLLDDIQGALWTRELIDRARVTAAPELDRVIVAVDPPVSAHRGSDECGIVVAGIKRTGDRDDGYASQIFVLADCSAQGERPTDWARRAHAAYQAHGADRLVAEVNQGGDLVEAVLRQVAPDIAYHPVRASRGKQARAEPVAALYEQGRVHHVGVFPELEDQLCRYTGAGDGIQSPDRLDALVWAVAALTEIGAGPRSRCL